MQLDSASEMSSDDGFLSREELVANIRRLLEDNPSFDALNAAYATLKEDTKKQVMPQRSLDFLTIFTPLIAEHLSFRDCLVFTQACKVTRSWKNNIIKNRVHSLLSQYVSDSVDFRSLMRLTGCVISGSSVVQLLGHPFLDWTPGDLDVYTPRHIARFMVDYFKKEGYIELPKAFPDLEEDYVVDGTRLANVIKMEKGDKKVDIIESGSDSSVEPITNFHSTLVMNYIAADSISSLYPTVTFAQASVTQENIRNGSDTWRSRYTSRGYELFSSLETPSSYMDVVCPALPRSTADKYALLLPFEEKDDSAYRSQLRAKWKFDSPYYMHRNCLAHACNVGSYLKQPPSSSAVELVARRTACDVMCILNSASTVQSASHKFLANKLVQEITSSCMRGQLWDHPFCRGRCIVSVNQDV